MPSFLTIEEVQACSKPAGVAETVGVTKRKVYRLIKRSKERVTLKHRPRYGRSRGTDVQTDTQIVGNFCDHPFKTVRSVALIEIGPRLSR